jgi:hypothetical protein
MGPGKVGTLKCLNLYAVRMIKGHHQAGHVVLLNTW